MLEALEVEPAQEAGIFARVACSGVVDPEPRAKGYSAQAVKRDVCRCAEIEKETHLVDHRQHYLFLCLKQ